MNFKAGARVSGSYGERVSTGTVCERQGHMPIDLTKVQWDDGQLSWPKTRDLAPEPDPIVTHPDPIVTHPDPIVTHPDPIVTHPDGGRHRPAKGDLTLFPPESILAASVVLARGADEYGVDNWRRLPLREHLRHALEHVYLWLSGDRSEPHLTHAMLRLAFAAALEENKP